MSENPGPASPGTPTHGDGQEHAPTGTGPNEADVNQDPVDTSAEEPDEEGRSDAG
ncbi:hypothetical protein [Cellulomonas xiejunii]|uniref:Uncharacterized protein n=1 Tax=Cellulomonas xiejunii TaxID=2968083 RepID=A0ABY5KQZ9_9CELL|nr:hypothetical protein [Cellulomonas xiejunii]MCC2322642.1 hypothetical protein [Cellulomonas xiejunii]UUI72674.1 hypothetical protein NP048_04240 [Cellulomonas xiejunii]